MARLILVPGLCLAALPAVSPVPAPAPLFLSLERADCPGPGAERCWTGQLDWAGLAAARALVLPGGSVLARVGPVQNGGGGRKTTEYSGLSGSKAVITAVESTRVVYGAVEMADRVFTLESDDQDQALWTEVDPTAWADETEPLPAPPASPVLTAARAVGLLARGRTDINTVAEYTVTVYYTSGLAASTKDPITFIKQVVAETNAGYANSRIPIRVR